MTIVFYEILNDIIQLVLVKSVFKRFGSSKPNANNKQGDKLFSRSWREKV